MNRLQLIIFNIKRKLGLIKFTYESQSGVNSRYNELKEFVEEIVGYDIDGIFISDQSSLCDFEEYSGKGPSLSDFVEKVKIKYKCDISKVKTKFLIEIIDFMKNKGVKFTKYNYKGKKSFGF